VSLPRSCPLHTVDHFGSEVKGDFYETRLYLNVFCVFNVKTTCSISKKTQFTGFLFRHVEQKHYLGKVRLGNKRILNIYFRSNIFVKNHPNRFMYDQSYCKTNQLH